MNEKLPTYGGQAVIEGVMMRGSQSVAIAMRAPNQEIVIHTEPLAGIYKSKIGKIPFLRGVIGLWDALVLGMRALTLSANLQSDEDEKLEGPALYLTLGTSLVIAVGLFMLLPMAASHLFTKILGLSTGWLILAEGILRLGIVIGYIWAVGRSSEIRRVFAYHGAEHKTINAFEDGAELTPENVARYSLEHPRCGTAFLLSLVLLGIFVFSLFSPLPMLWQYLSRILLLPVLAGLAYEYIRWTANHLESPFVRLIVRPNLALQHLTTREPSLEMLEVSIAAFKAMHTQERQLHL